LDICQKFWIEYSSINLIHFSTHPFPYLHNMKSTILLFTVAFAGSVFAAEPCKDPVAAATSKIIAKPDAVLEVVATDVAAAPKCACPIVLAAIETTKANNDLKGDILAAALNAAPDEAAALKACVPMNQGDSGKGVTGKGVVGKEPVGKAPVAGKEVVTTPPADDTLDGWFDPLIYGAGGMGLGVGAGGVYTSSPGSSTGVDLNGEPEVIVVIEDDNDRPVIVIRPGTRSRATF
jgi:hypothetical protein